MNRIYPWREYYGTAPAQCQSPDCGEVFESGLVAGVVIGCATTCPRCGANAEVADMIYQANAGGLRGLPASERSQAILDRLFGRAAFLAAQTWEDRESVRRLYAQLSAYRVASEPYRVSVGEIEDLPQTL